MWRTCEPLRVDCLLRCPRWALAAWVAVLDNCRRCPVPKAIVLIMPYLAKALRGLGRLTTVGTPVACEKRLFQCPERVRTDAKAQGDEVWIGGWALDHADTKKCRWFAERLNHANAPWLYTSAESYRLIASLELLAAVSAVRQQPITRETAM